MNCEFGITIHIIQWKQYRRVLMSTEYSAEEIHSRLLVMAKTFHGICVENNLRYYMLGGTMLGAVRHKGFIPWDDDMDFGMPREDYDRFISVSNKILPEYYEIRFYKNTDNSPIHYAKLIDNRTTLVEASYTNYVEGLYIDIFPLDGAGNGMLFDRIRAKRILWHQILIMNHCTTRDKKGIRKLLKKYARFRNINNLHDSMEKLMTAKTLSESSLIANYLGAWAEKEIMPKDVMGTPALYTFEDAEFYGSENADKYLKSLYGDYMKLPPKENQVFKHNYYYLNYDLPYREYDSQKD